VVCRAVDGRWRFRKSAAGRSGGINFDGNCRISPTGCRGGSTPTVFHVDLGTSQHRRQTVKVDHFGLGDKLDRIKSGQSGILGIASG
jgi:hypothetical protein